MWLSRVAGPGAGVLFAVAVAVTPAVAEAPAGPTSISPLAARLSPAVVNISSIHHGGRQCPPKSS